jgi:rfaE bifunctional protein nucleotidyltransferase chain/domain
MRQSKKIIKQSAVHILSKQLQNEGKKVVLATGCFDILHAGHVQLFRKAKQHGDILIVGANSDKSIRKLKGVSRPIVSLNERLANIAEIASVDYVTVFGEHTPAELISRIKPHLFIKGGDWSSKKLIEEHELNKYGGRVIFIPIRIKTSTTALYDKKNN